jgi:hypothetical protein
MRLIHFALCKRQWGLIIPIPPRIVYTPCAGRYKPGINCVVEAVAQPVPEGFQGLFRFYFQDIFPTFTIIFLRL